MRQLNNILLKGLFILLINIYTLNISANNRPLKTIHGVIKDNQEESIESATIFIKELNKGTLSNAKGEFNIRVKPGVYNLTIQFVGYETYQQQVEITPRKDIFLDIRLKEASYNLKEVVIESKSPVQRVKETALNVVAIDTKKLYNTNLDIANTLSKVSGVKIRELGGVGSDTQISLNGFTGKHIKVFMDGVPMEGAGSSFQINNIPINLAERIEVYKGVVPVDFGGDALGGAINIVTKKSSNTYVDASYTYGSYNTHKSNLSFGYTAKNGFNLSINAYQNYSDNNYKVKTKLLDLETGNFSNNTYWFKRFNDTYHNEAIIAKIGVVNKSWADRLLFGITLSNESAEIQNANLMHIVYGGKKREAKGFMPTLTYAKRDLFIKNLHLNVNAQFNKIQSRNIDTLARQYNWSGQYKTKSSKGEGQYTMGKYNNENFFTTVNLNYSIVGKHFFTLNDVYSSFERKSSDDAANQINTTAATFMRRKNIKNVIGLSYKFMPISTWNILAFTKHYRTEIKGPVDISETTTANYVEQSRQSNITGYGVASTYHITPSIQVKVSYEKAFRLPNERELFGDEVLETGNYKLKPEKSNNLNANISFDKTFKKAHNISLDAGFIYRITEDYIRRIIEERYGGAFSTNHGKTSNIGADLEARYSYKNTLVIGGNITYQNMRNKKKYSPSGQELIYYNDRVPNQPYLFANMDASYNFNNLILKQDQMSIGYNMRYVHQFYRDWKSEGADIIIPKQLSHDVSLTYSLKNGTYNIALEANNITDVILYDNYSLQKPGRNFSLKFRYFFFRTKY